LPLFSPFSGYSSGVLFHLFLGKRDVTAVQRFWEVGCGESLRLKIPSNPVLERARALRLLQSSIYYILRDVGRRKRNVILINIAGTNGMPKRVRGS